MFNDQVEERRVYSGNRKDGQKRRRRTRELLGVQKQQLQEVCLTVTGRRRRTTWRACGAETCLFVSNG